MKAQPTFSDVEFSSKRRQSKREIFLGLMEQVVPWGEIIELIEPYYPKGERGRRPTDLQLMLRVYFLQIWFGLSDPGLEDHLYDSQAMRSFAGIDFSKERNVPDETTLLKFRHLLTKHNLQAKILRKVNALLEAKGILLKQGTVIDATIIAAPCSIKNSTKSRDPDMGHTQKGQQWYFGAKAHIGIDAQSGCVHSVVTGSAKEADITRAAELLHGQEEMILADAGYTGLSKREEMQEAVSAGVSLQIAERRGKIESVANEKIKKLLKELEHARASVRSKVEHVFHVVKNLFGYRKVRYRGIRKNHAHHCALMALANLYLMRRRLA